MAQEAIAAMQQCANLLQEGEQFLPAAWLHTDRGKVSKKVQSMSYQAALDKARKKRYLGISFNHNKQAVYFFNLIPTDESKIYSGSSGEKKRGKGIRWRSLTLLSPPVRTENNKRKESSTTNVNSRPRNKNWSLKKKKRKKMRMN